MAITTRPQRNFDCLVRGAAVCLLCRPAQTVNCHAAHLQLHNPTGRQASRCCRLHASQQCGSSAATCAPACAAAALLSSAALCGSVRSMAGLASSDRRGIALLALLLFLPGLNKPTLLPQALPADGRSGVALVPRVNSASCRCTPIRTARHAAVTHANQ